MRLRLSLEAQSQWVGLQSQRELRSACKAVGQCLAFLQAKFGQPGLHCHQHQSLSQRHGVKVFEAHLEKQGSGAWRVFWANGPEADELSILAILPHP